MKSNKRKIETLFTKGIIGKLLLEFILKKHNGSGTDLIAQIAVFSSFEANKKALKTKLPVIIEEDHKLYEINSNGNKKFIKHLKRSGKTIPQDFILK